MSLANKFGIPQGLLDAAKAALDEANEYQKKVQAHMAKKGIKSMSDMSADQKKKFFNELDAMHTAKHEEVEPIEELSKHKLASHAAQAGAMAQMHNTQVQRSSDASEIEKHSKLASKRLSGAAKAHRKLNAEEVESFEEAQSHQAKTTMKHISNPTAGEKKAAKDIKPGVAGYRDRVAMLKSAEARGALKKEEAELTQEDLDFIASLNEASKGHTLEAHGVKGMKSTPWRKSFKSAEHMSDWVEKNDAEVHGTRDLEKSVKSGMKEDLDLEDFTIEQIEEYMQTEDFAQLDELRKTTIANYIKKRSHDVATQGALTRAHTMDSDAKRKEQNYRGARDSNDKANRAFMKGWKHRENIAKAVDRLTKD